MSFCVFHPAEAGLIVNILERFVVQFIGSRDCYIVKLVVCWHIVGIIERRRLVSQVEIHFCVDVGSIGSKPTISVDVFDHFDNRNSLRMTDAHSNDYKRFVFQMVT